MKIKPFIAYLFLISIVLCSCGKDLESMIKADYRVIDFDYYRHNYESNIRDKSEPLIIRERNIVEVDISASGEVIIEGKKIAQDSIISELKKFLIPNPSNREMPETIQMDLPYSGKVASNREKLLISAAFKKEMTYEKYSAIRRKFFIAYNEVRNDFAQKKFGKTLYDLMRSEESSDQDKYYEIASIFRFNYVEVILEQN